MMHYLYQVKNPNLQYSIQQEGSNWNFKYRWSNISDEIEYPLMLRSGEKINPKTYWQEIKLDHQPQLDEESYLFDKELLK
jgi:hypothetical protein